MARALDPSGWAHGALREAWRSARPFPHVVIDDVSPPEALAGLERAFEREEALPIQDEIFDVLASSPDVEEPAFRRFREDLEAPATRALVRAISGEEVTRADARAYAYLPGHYLLPHADEDDGRRRVAYAFYVANLEGLAGGELELFDCSVDDGEIVETQSGRLIAPRPNRLVLFQVTPRSLHQVREVTAGGRLSLAGWFSR